MSPNFRINARKFAITISNPFGQPSWNRQEFDKQYILDHYKSIPGVKYVLVARELHQSGEIHFHALVRFQDKKDIRRSDFFNINGCQANVQAARAPWINYCKKTGDFIESEETEESIPSLREAAESMVWVDYLEYLHKQQVQFGIGKAMWEVFHGEVDTTVYEPGEGEECDQLQQYVYDFRQRRSLVLVGRTGCGKTSWAKRNAPKPTLLVRHADQLKRFDATTHASIIFDDLDFKQWPRHSQIYLVDTDDDAPIHRRYGITTIPARTPRIFTANEHPFIDDPAINRRINKVIIN